MARVNVFAVCMLAVATSLAPGFAQITTPNAQVVAGIEQLSKVRRGTLSSELENGLSNSSTGRANRFRCDKETRGDM